MTDHISARKEYLQLINLLEETRQKISEIEPDAKVLLMIEAKNDISLVTPAEHMETVDILGLLRVMTLRYEVLEAHHFQQKLAVQEAMNNPAIQLVPKNDKPN